MTSRTTQVFFLFFSIGILAGGCKVDPIGEPIIVSLIDKEFTLDLWENLQSTAASPLEIHLATITDEDCLNAQVLSDYKRNIRLLNVTVYDILDPETCDPGQAPATGLEAIDDVGLGLYSLEVELQGVVINTGTITITNASYEVTMLEENGISWLHYKLLRVPAFSLWGYVTFTNADQQAAANDFVNALSDISDEMVLSDGYYGYFNISNGGTQVSINKMPELVQGIPFLFRYNGDKTAIDELVNNFTATAPEGVAFVVLNQAGDVWE